MSRKPRPLAALALVALISLISAGCGSNAPSETGTASSTGTGGTKKATDQGKLVKFAECIRGHGVPHSRARTRRASSSLGSM